MSFTTTSTPPKEYLAESAERPRFSVVAISDCYENSRCSRGRDNGGSPSSATWDWMAKLSDDMKLVDMNFPGTHDAGTWDYSEARQAELMKYTGPIRAAAFFRCQERSLVQSLNDGIRVFDLRLGYNPGNDTIGFYHGVAMLGPTTTFQDVLYGLYSWLTEHPTETVLVSINQEAGSKTLYDKKFEEILFATLNNQVGKRFWLPAAAKVLISVLSDPWCIHYFYQLGTLGAARGKLVLLQRFTYQFLNTPPSNPFGIHLDAEQWTPNGGNIELIYHTGPKRVAHIQDMFMPLVPRNSGADVNIASKFEAVTGHLTKAMNNSRDVDAEEELYISFASAHANADDISVTPNIMALGDASTKGMNERLLPWFAENKGKRFGVVMLDFYNSQPGLVAAIIGL
ncbi:PLC-like phosphodiesterase [Mycena crocata]|nr:PLC-like phosphodiesterase [Mycena crocata]